MKIYHTETQADYDALMVELESEGYIWKGTEDKPTQWNGWKLTGKETIVRSNGSFITQGTISDYKSIYEQTPIVKYKAKSDEKIIFTKEDFEKAGVSWFDHNEALSLGDLLCDISKLDDTPEKVVVPKFVAEWIEWNKGHGVGLQNMLKCYAHFYGVEESDDSSEGLKAVKWYVDNPYKFIRAYEEGYTTTSL